MDRRDFLLRATGAGVLAALAPDLLGAQAKLPPMTVYHSPLCGCCKEWIKHVQQNGFTVRPILMEDLHDVKASAGVPRAYESCHTAMVGGIAVEGHVPADLIKKALAAPKGTIVGLAVPGMPQGSPGMEQGMPKDAYDVMVWDGKGARRVYARR